MDNIKPLKDILAYHDEDFLKYFIEEMMKPFEKRMSEVDGMLELLCGDYRTVDIKDRRKIADAAREVLRVKRVKEAAGG